MFEDEELRKYLDPRKMEWSPVSNVGYSATANSLVYTGYLVLLGQ
jgi:hypothetical protein